MTRTDAAAIQECAVRLSQIHDPQVPGQPSGDPEMDQMLQARAGIRSVLDELDRLSGALQACSSPTRA